MGVNESCNECHSKPLYPSEKVSLVTSCPSPQSPISLDLSLSVLLSLYLSAAPEWVEHIVSAERDIGSSYTMSCEASGKPKPHIRWMKNGFLVTSTLTTTTTTTLTPPLSPCPLHPDTPTPRAPRNALRNQPKQQSSYANSDRSFIA